MRHQVLVAVSVALALSLVRAVAPGAASAQSPGDPAFDEGRKRLQSGDFAGACASFKTSYDSSPTPGKAFNLATCEEKQGHLTRAVGWLNEGIRGLDANDSRRRPASEQREALESRLARLTVVAPSPSPSGTRVTVDGDAFDLGVRRPVDPGAHRIVTHVDGHRDTSVELVLAERESKEITASVGPLSPSTAPLAPVAPGRPEIPANPGSTQRLAGFIVGGFGVAGLVGFGVTAGLVAGAKSDFDDARTAKEAESARSRGHRLEIAEGALLGVGAAAGATGLILVLTAPRNARAPTVTTSLLPFGVVTRASW